MLQKELSKKLKTISRLPFLETVDYITLIGLANNLTNFRCNMGEVKLVIEEYHTVSTERSIFNRGLRVPPRQIRLKDYHPFDAEAHQKSIEPKRIFKPLAEAKVDKKAFFHDKIENGDEKSVLYRDHVKYGVLKQGQFFGGRSLLVDEFGPNGGEPFLEDNKNYPSKVSVVVSSATATMYIIDKKSLNFVGIEL